MRFTLSELFLAMTLMAVGLGAFAVAGRFAPLYTVDGLLPLQGGLIWGGAMAVGQGAMLPFKKPQVGLLIGICLYFPTALAIL